MMALGTSNGDRAALIHDQIADTKTGQGLEQARTQAQRYEDFNEKHNSYLAGETGFPGNTRLSCGIRSGAAWLGKTE